MITPKSCLQFLEAVIVGTLRALFKSSNTFTGSCSGWTHVRMCYNGEFLSLSDSLTSRKPRTYHVQLVAQFNGSALKIGWGLFFDVFSKVPWCPRLYQPRKCEAGIMFNPYVQARFPCSKFYNTAAGQREHSGLCSVQLPTLAAEEEYWSTLIANHAQTMGNQRMRLGQRKEAQRWTVIQWFNQANWTPYIQYELILV
ncbi:hypothetical protein B0H14DRAFT_3128654 [Mycena olivaceomarginata]|nr:hypothetical protein B0H14DRAFT_3128654 [Mycena olivaceomarginata]